ncbi:MAG: cell wall-active antibiotics response protein LiaF [Candidatus Limnocylindrales bacterium]
MRSAGEVIGLILMFAGVTALLGSLGADAGLADALGCLWPLLIVGLGLWLVWVAGNRRHSSPPVRSSAWGHAVSAHVPDGWGWAAHPLPAAHPGPAAPGSADQSGWSAAAWAWGPGVRRDRRFIGEIEMTGPMQAGPMQIETFIGEVRLDLTQATVPDGETPIHVSTAIGEVRVLLPADVAASVRATSLLGDSEALGRTSGAFLGDARAETDGYFGATRRIRVEAQSLIGEVAVRRIRLSAGTDPRVSPTGAGAPGHPTPPAEPGDSKLAAWPPAGADS